jgi:hypothetical protein
MIVIVNSHYDDAISIQMQSPYKPDIQIRPAFQISAFQTCPANRQRPSEEILDSFGLCQSHFKLVCLPLKVVHDSLTRPNLKNRVDTSGLIYVAIESILYRMVGKYMPQLHALRSRVCLS